MSLGWHCQEDHVSNEYLFRWRASPLWQIPAVWSCIKTALDSVDWLVYPEPMGADDTSTGWLAFLESHGSHRLLIVSEFGEFSALKQEEEVIECSCGGKRLTLAHEHTEGARL